MPNTRHAKTPSKPPSQKGSQRKASPRPYNLDGQAVLDGLRRGKSPNKIAQEQGLAHTTVTRFLAKIRPHFQGLESITANRGNILNILHTKSLSVMNAALDEVEKIVRENEKRGTKEKLSLPQLLNIIRGVGMNQAVLYDKMRLEGGQSTNNLSLAARVEYLDKVGLFDPSTGEMRSECKQASPFALKQPSHKLMSSSQAIDNIEYYVGNVG